ATVERFVDTEYPKVVAAVRLITGDRESAEDAVQDALVKAWQRPDADQIESLAAWVTVVASNNACSRLRRRAAQQRAYDRSGVTSDAGDPPDRSVDSITVRDALAELPDRQREVATLYYLLDQPIRAIAAALGVGEGTVKTSLS